MPLRQQLVSDTGSDLEAAVAHARDSDAAIVVIGLNTVDEGEALVAMDSRAISLMNPPLAWKPVAHLTSWLFRLHWLRRRQTGGDCRKLGLQEEQLELISRISTMNPRTIVVIIAGSTVLVDPWQDQVAALLLAWYPGMEGGHAIADIVLGNSEPGGGLPLVIPAQPAQLPDFDPEADRVGEIRKKNSGFLHMSVLSQRWITARKLESGAQHHCRKAENSAARNIQ